MKLILAGTQYQVESYCYHFGVSRQSVRPITSLAKLPEHDCSLVLYGTWNTHADSQRILAAALMRGWPVRDENHGVDLHTPCKPRALGLLSNQRGSHVSPEN